MAVRVMGPAVSWLCAIGTTPFPEMRPRVGFRPKVEFACDGAMIEPSVSLPTATAHRLAAVATADPELDPHGLSSRT